MKTGLVLEGGGMRGLFTAGVLDYLMDEGLYPDYCIGVSAGACNGVSYLSGQRGRNKRINLQYAQDKRYVSVHNFLHTKSMFGMDFIFKEIPDKLDPFDYDAFQASPIEFCVGVTDVYTGKSCYFGKEAIRHDSTVLRASSSIPVFSPAVPFQGGLYLDGGTADPIPIRKAFADGCERAVVVLTRDRGYIKQPESMRGVYRRALRRYPHMVEALDNRHSVYNETRKLLAGLEKDGRVLVIAPAEEIKLSRFEKNPDKLAGLYDQGYEAARLQLTALRSFLYKTEQTVKED